MTSCFYRAGPSCRRCRRYPPLQPKHRLCLGEASSIYHDTSPRPEEGPCGILAPQTGTAGTSSLQPPWHPQPPGKCHWLLSRTSQPTGHSASPETQSPPALEYKPPNQKIPACPGETLYPGNKNTQAVSIKAGMTEPEPHRPQTLCWAQSRSGMGTRMLLGPVPQPWQVLSLSHSFFLLLTAEMSS